MAELKAQLKKKEEEAKGSIPDGSSGEETGVSTEVSTEVSVESPEIYDAGQNDKNNTAQKEVSEDAAAAKKHTEATVSAEPPAPSTKDATEEEETTEATPKPPAPFTFYINHRGSGLCKLEIAPEHRRRVVWGKIGSTDELGLYVMDPADKFKVTLFQPAIVEGRIEETSWETLVSCTCPAPCPAPCPTPCPTLSPTPCHTPPPTPRPTPRPKPCPHTSSNTFR